MGCTNASQIFFIFVILLLGQNWSASIVNSMSTLCVHLLCEESSISVDNHDFCFSYHVFITESFRLWSFSQTKGTIFQKYMQTDSFKSQPILQSNLSCRQFSTKMETKLPLSSCFYKHRMKSFFVGKVLIFNKY